MKKAYVTPTITTRRLADLPPAQIAVLWQEYRGGRIHYKTHLIFRRDDQTFSAWRDATWLIGVFGSIAEAKRALDA